MAALTKTSLQPALALLPIRLVTGWLFFSAFHRRVVLDAAKLVPGAPGYVGEKFNQFMPGSILGVDQLIAALLDRPDALQAFLWSFTIIEALVGLALILGLGTRLAAFGVLMLSAKILFGSGWLGPTCLDEWQIGAFGIAGGATLMMGGAGPLSLDAWLFRARPALVPRGWLRRLADPSPSPSLAAAGALTLFSVVVTLATNQVFYGGLWGELHNDSVRPRVDVLEARLDAEGDLRLTIERPAGPETYGAFLVEVRVLDAGGEVVRRHDARVLAALSPAQLDNRWLVKVRPGPHGLVVPLGARATFRLPGAEGAPALSPGTYRVELEDVSGLRWSHAVALERAES
ncbi:TQO small subunit DoxD [Chondromyces crocatus]|uniref:Quinol oxidase n=1 Tax=Chondromyces crocatus TaxID=52 RepID=A0A0K1EJZ4_CHOCO|nr:TQO small subunit DoxD [Chondromyces crocatus]AKT41181.1 quinol oxidase [Chondromyces crocatus]